MSAANRGSDRHPQDAYITPLWAVERLLDAYVIPNGATVLDPCAARGELLSVVKRRVPQSTITGIELRPECWDGLYAVTTNSGLGDFLDLGAKEPMQRAQKEFDFCITNPPFSLAEEFLIECRRIAKVTIFLQRINWLCGGRDQLFKTAEPGLFVLPQRPSFTGYGADATEYAWYIFDEPAVARSWRMLDRTPASEIAEHNRRARELNPWAKKKQTDLIIEEAA